MTDITLQEATLTPLKSKILIEIIEKEIVTDGGIVLVKPDRDQASYAKVIAVGPDCVDVKKDNTILPDWNKARIASGAIYIIDESDIVAICEETIDDNATL